MSPQLRLVDFLNSQPVPLESLLLCQLSHLIFYEVS